MRNAAALVAAVVVAFVATSGCSRDDMASSSTHGDLAAVTASPDLISSQGDWGVATPDLEVDDLAYAPSWHQEVSGTVVTLNGVWGRNADDVWISGASGTLLHSTTRGAKWSPVNVGADVRDLGVIGLGEQDLYVVGGEPNGPYIVYHSSDSGKTWKPEHPDDLSCCLAFNALGSDVYATGAGLLYHSTVNAQGAWTTIPVNTALGGSWDLSSVLLLPGGRIYLGSSNGKMWYSDDQAKTWVDARIPLFQFGFTFTIWSGLSGNDLYAAGAGGDIAHTGDGGKTWNIQYSSVPNHVNEIALIWGSSPKDIYATNSTSGYLHSSDGKTWVEQPLFPQAPMFYSNGVWGSAANDVYIVGSGGVIEHYY